MKMDVSLKELERKSCWCGNCDGAKTMSPKWYEKCRKEFPESWILIEGIEGNP